jgi:hypothetical protein
VNPGADPHEIRIAAAGDVKEEDSSVDLTTGEWYQLRLQIFPDGTCGIAVNGHAIARTTSRIPFDTRYRVEIAGRSVDVRMLVGPLEVWTGVKTDVDWGAPGGTGGAAALIRC